MLPVPYKMIMGNICRHVNSNKCASLSFLGFGRARALHFLDLLGSGRSRVSTFRAPAGTEPLQIPDQILVFLFRE